MAGALEMSPMRPASMERATKRVVPTPLGKWLLEKTLYLNNSRTKRIVLGLDLERQLAAFAFIDNGGGLGVRVDAQDMRELFALDWQQKVKKHLRTPSLPGAVRVCSNSDFRLNIIRDCEPGMKISSHGEDGKHNFVVLGYVTCVRLYRLAPSILRYISHLESLQGPARQWLLDALDKLQVDTLKRGLSSLPNEKEACDILEQAGGLLCGQDVPYDARLDFTIDLHYRYRDIFARMLYDVCDRHETSTA